MYILYISLDNRCTASSRNSSPGCLAALEQYDLNHANEDADGED